MGTDTRQGPVASVFGLSQDELHPVVEAAVGESVASFQISVEHELIREYYGFAAEKVIPTFRYVTAQGRRGQVTIFAKHPHDPAAAEPEQYRFLRLHGVPLPDLYGVLRSPEGRPVLFLEYLDMGELGRPSLPPNVRLEFLSLMARFNAVHPSHEYAAWLKEGHQEGDDPGLAWVIDVVWGRACDGGLGEDLKRFCSEDETRQSRLRALADRVAAQVNDMPTGLVSGDLSFENTGLRQNGERVMFDVEGVELGARFTDVAGMVGRPDDRWPSPPYASRETLVEHYLHEYVRWGGTAPPLDQFLAETRVLWLRGEILSMNFGAGWGHADSPAPEHQRQASRRGLLRILTMLVERYC